MLVKIVAVGLNPTLWKNVFHHLRTVVPQEPFSAAIFSAPDEVAYLEQEYFPVQWRREGPDVLLSDAGPPLVWRERLRFLEKVGALPGVQPPVTALALPSLEHGLKQLMQGGQAVTFHLDNGARFHLSDPGLLLSAFPEKYPRLRVDDHLNALRVPDGEGRTKEIKPPAMPEYSLVNLSQVESVRHGEEILRPEDWVRRVTRFARITLPPGFPVALYREPGGIFLCPGVPLPRVSAVTVGGVHFQHVLDLGVMSESSPGFVALGQAVARSGSRHGAAIDALTNRARDAESQCDLPIRCVGGLDNLNRFMAEALAARGYQRVSAHQPGERPDPMEPGLLLQLAPDGAEMKPQAEEPILLEIGAEIEPALSLLDDLLDWRVLPGPTQGGVDPGGNPARALRGEMMERDAFIEERARLTAREEKARSGLEFADRRILLLEQEAAVLQSASQKLARLLGPGVEIWNGAAPTDAGQWLVLSHDDEEAQQVLRAGTGLPKKRWFDLALCADADALHNLDLEPLETYGRGGVVTITESARERLEELSKQQGARRDEAVKQVADARSAIEQYKTETERVAGGKRALAARWIRQCLDNWLAENERGLLEALAILRVRHERDWFNRGQVNRIVVAASNSENRKALLEACEEIYPHYNPELSVIVPYDFEVLEELPDNEREAIEAREAEARRSPEQIAARKAEALEKINARNLEDYLQVVGLEAKELPRVDLLLIENRPDIAERLLNQLRRVGKPLAEAPAVMVFPDSWNPAPGARLAWPRTRTVVIRRMGALSAPVCAEKLRALYAK